MTKEKELRELAHRRGDGIEVTLRWRPEDDAIVLAVEDWATGDAFEVEVDRDRALDAFRHPFAYMRGRSGPD